MTRFLQIALFGSVLLPIAGAAAARAADLDYGYPPPPPRYERPVVVRERPVIVERPVVVERRVVVERPVVVERRVVRPEFRPYPWRYGYGRPRSFGPYPRYAFGPRFRPYGY